MSWSIASDLLPGLMVIYVCVGIGVGTGMVILFIRKHNLTQETFPFCIEAVLCYGPVAAILAFQQLRKLGRFLWTRDYRAWYNRQKEAVQSYLETRKKAHGVLKSFKQKQKQKAKQKK